MILYVATSNKGKLKEISEVLSDVAGVEVRLPPDGFVFPEETGKTYAENASLKAKALAQFTGAPAIADDSGLEVFYLKKAPGIESARWASTDEERIKKLLNLLRGVEFKKRKARFVAVIAFAFFKDGKVKIKTFNGMVYGYISPFPEGDAGFGYDPVFFYPPAGATFATRPDVKAKVSHRVRALEKFKKYLMKNLKKLEAELAKI